MNFLKGCLQGDAITLPKPAPAQRALLLSRGRNWSPLSLETPSDSTLLPRCFEKHQLRLEQVRAQVVVYGMAKGMVIFTRNPSPFTMCGPTHLFSFVCMNINTQRISECASSVFVGITG